MDSYDSLSYDSLGIACDFLVTLQKLRIIKSPLRREVEANLNVRFIKNRFKLIEPLLKNVKV